MPGVAEARLDFVNRKLVVSYSERWRMPWNAQSLGGSIERA